MFLERLQAVSEPLLIVTTAYLIVLMALEGWILSLPRV
jgi:hypothetical protein